VLRRLERLVDRGFQREHRAFPISTIGGDHQFCFGVFDASTQALGAEATKDDRVNRANARDREHRDHRFGNHRHVDDDPVALAHTHRAQ